MNLDDQVKKNSGIVKDFLSRLKTKAEAISNKLPIGADEVKADIETIEAHLDADIDSGASALMAALHAAGLSAPVPQPETADTPG